MQQIEIYTDGGCHRNPGPGAWAFVLRTGTSVLERSGADRDTTNNRMELRAVIEALKSIDEGGNGVSRGEVIVHTDSRYVKLGITEWMCTWMRNGWQTSVRKPVKNQDLWIELNRESERVGPSWRWVKGHTGNEWNERCDQLVQDAIAAATG